MKKKSRTSFNISLVIFLMIFIYLLATIVIYFTTDHITSYQVKPGTLSQNSTYMAVALRDETVVTSPGGGYLTYYVPEGGRTAVNETVYSVNASPQTLPAADSAGSNSDKTLETLKQLSSDFSGIYSSDRYNSVYDLQYSLKSQNLTASRESTAGTEVKADSDGIISYYTDGYEPRTADTVTEDDFIYNKYHKQRLQTSEAVSAGAPVYKLINSENWSIVIPLSEGQLNRISSYETIPVRFEKDGKTETGTVRLFDRNEQHYAEISFTNGMVRYCKERFLDVELITNSISGLKVPKSAIIQKDFYLIPEEYAVKGGTGGETGFMVETTDKKGNQTSVFVAGSIFDKAGINTAEGTLNMTGSDASEEDSASFYLVEKEYFNKGDRIIRPDSEDRYAISETVSLDGVYNINKGYALFEKVTIIDSNEEYCIISNDERSDLMQFDYIVRNGADVHEDQILR